MLFLLVTLLLLGLLLKPLSPLNHGLVYPIASGVIEGACRHLVKDRLERTGMRWREPSAGAMLFVRALEVTGLWEPFQKHRQTVEHQRLHPHQTLLNDYLPNPAIAL